MRQREREREKPGIRGVQTHPCGSMNPGTGSVCGTPKRDALDSAGSLNGLEKFLSAFRRNLPIDRGKKGKGDQRVLLLATPQQGTFPVDRIQRGAG
jgi:hypothetical protein